LSSDLGDYIVTIIVSDSIDSVSSSFSISVVNNPPYFVSAIPTDFTMRFNTTYVYFIPEYADKEGHAVTVLLDSQPPG